MRYFLAYFWPTLVSIGFGWHMGSLFGFWVGSRRFRNPHYIRHKVLLRAYLPFSIGAHVLVNALFNPSTGSRISAAILDGVAVIIWIITETDDDDYWKQLGRRLGRWLRRHLPHPRPLPQGT